LVQLLWYSEDTRDQEETMTSKAVNIALTILTCTSLSLPPTTAEAGMRTGTWRNGMVAGSVGIFV
jgi:hypothetical protein